MPPKNNNVVVNQNQYADPSRNPLSPYYIHPAELNVTALVNPILAGTSNYHGWARLMRKALITKNKIKFIDGSLPVPDTFDPSYEAFERCNNIVHSWILN